MTLLGSSTSLLGNGSYVIKARNETSGHFIYFVFIGSSPPPAWVVEKQFETGGLYVGNVPANGFEKTIAVAVNGTISRFGGYTSSGHMESLGTLNVVLTYHDVPLGRDIQRALTVEVLLLKSS